MSKKKRVITIILVLAIILGVAGGVGYKAYMANTYKSVTYTKSTTSGVKYTETVTANLKKDKIQTIDLKGDIAVSFKDVSKADKKKLEQGMAKSISQEFKNSVIESSVTTEKSSVIVDFKVDPNKLTDSQKEFYFGKDKKITIKAFVDSLVSKGYKEVK